MLLIIMYLPQPETLVIERLQHFLLFFFLITEIFPTQNRFKFYLDFK